MIQVIYGGKGSGKTKRLLDLVSATTEKANGSLVFINRDDNFSFSSLDHNIRFINAKEYGIVSPKVFTGFILGISAQDFDLEYIFVDGFLKIVNHSIFELEDMFRRLDEFTTNRNITLVISVSCEEPTPPEYLNKYII